MERFASKNRRASIARSNFCAATGLAGLLLASGVTAAAHAADAPVDAIQRTQNAARRDAWRMVFPGSTLDGILIFSEPIGDASTLGSFQLSLVDGSQGKALGSGLYHITSATEQRELATDAGENFGGFVTQSYRIVAGVIENGVRSRNMAAIEIKVELHALELIAPVQARVLVPLAITQRLFHSELVADGAAVAFDPAVQTAYSSAPVTPSSGGGELSSDTTSDEPTIQVGGDVDPDPDQPFDCNEHFSECQKGAWNHFTLVIEDEWILSGLYGPCMADTLAKAGPHSGSFVQFLQGALLSCGIGAIAAGNGPMAWAYAAQTFQANDCEIQRQQCEDFVAGQ